MFTILTDDESIEDPAGVFPQSQIDPGDIDILLAGIAGDGVRGGCAVAAQGTPNMTTALAAGTIATSGAEVVVSAATVTHTAANPTNPRFDLVTINNAGAATAVAGTAIQGPRFPAIPVDSIAVASVYIPAADTAIQSDQIVDKRVEVKAPLSVNVDWTLVDLNADVINDNATANTLEDTGLQFAVTAGVTYFFRARILYTAAAAATGSRWTLNGPTADFISYFSRATISTEAEDPDQSVSGYLRTGYNTPAAASMTSADAGAGGNIASVEGFVRPNANGTVKIQFASEISGSAITAKKGSWLEYRGTT